MMLEKYDAYKDSGVEWLGEIPNNWEIKRLKAPLAERNEKNDPIKTDFILSLTMHQGVIPQSEKTGGGNKPKEDLTAYKLARPNDIVLNSMNVIVGSVGLSKYFGVVSPVYYMLYARDISKTNIGYYNYIFQSQAFQKNLGRLGTGILIKKSESSGKLNTIRMKISMDNLNNELLPIPSLDEQNKIVDFLNRKTSEIDQAIAIKEQQIALLNERKQIVIQKAVTQGLDPNVPMKDSGLNGVGNIPQDWEIIKFKYLAKVRYGLGQPPRQLDNGLKIIRATNIERGKIVEKGMLYIDPNDIPWDRNPTLNKDEIIVVRSGAYTGDSAIVTEEYAGCIAGYDMVATPFNCYPKFLSTVLLSHYVLYEQIYLLRMRSAQPHLNAEELNELKIVVPPINQQRLIANYIEKVESDIGEAISLIKQQLEKLKEYKTTLINDAVTGKIKVA
ncbi:restriction endonuclease subunit S [Acinetobacter sp. ANC 7200]|uniref:restriction endonuclease subunit S n=1 Tax=Acinetobacter TaxID=469 RepID=UPI001D0E098C|nr:MULTISPECIES: restriction endonuclease subunit S [Acinetobacter]MCL6244393.1 restriction endonuclease subunit S [Acinetobacter amyesii]